MLFIDYGLSCRSSCPFSNVGNRHIFYFVYYLFNADYLKHIQLITANKKKKYFQSKTEKLKTHTCKFLVYIKPSLS